MERKTKSLLRASLSAAVTFAALATTTNPVSAHFLGNHWSWGGGRCCLSLSYANTLSTDWRGYQAVDDAASNWTAITTVIGMNKVCYGCGQVITARGYFDSNSSYDGMSNVYATVCDLWCTSDQEIPYQACTDPCVLGGAGTMQSWSDYTRATMFLNKADSWYDQATEDGVANHEMGHDLGLSHNTNCGQTVMQPASPHGGVKSHDVYDLNKLYPSTDYSAVYAC